MTIRPMILVGLPLLIFTFLVIGTVGNNNIYILQPGYLAFLPHHCNIFLSNSLTLSDSSVMLQVRPGTSQTVIDFCLDNPSDNLTLTHVTERSDCLDPTDVNRLKLGQDSACPLHIGSKCTDIAEWCAIYQGNSVQCGPTLQCPHGPTYPVARIFSGHSTDIQNACPDHEHAYLNIVNRSPLVILQGTSDEIDTCIENGKTRGEFLINPTIIPGSSACVTTTPTLNFLRGPLPLCPQPAPGPCTEGDWCSSPYQGLIPETLCNDNGQCTNGDGPFISTAWTMSGVVGDTFPMSTCTDLGGAVTKPEGTQRLGEGTTATWIFTLVGSNKDVGDCIVAWGQDFQISRSPQFDICMNKDLSFELGNHYQCPIQPGLSCKINQWCHVDDYTASIPCSEKLVCPETSSLSWANQYPQPFVLGQTSRLTDLVNAEHCPGLDIHHLDTLYGKTFIYFENNLGEAAKCIESASALLQILTPASIDAQNCVSNVSFTPIIGNDPLCPLDYGSPCIESQHWCRSADEKSHQCSSLWVCLSDIAPPISPVVLTYNDIDNPPDLSKSFPDHCPEAETATLWSVYETPYIAVHHPDLIILKHCINTAYTAGIIGYNSYSEASDCFLTNPLRANLGGAEVCPLAFDAPCVHNQDYCQSDDVETSPSVRCPIEGKCPLSSSALTPGVHVVYTFSGKTVPDLSIYTRCQGITTKTYTSVYGINYIMIYHKDQAVVDQCLRRIVTENIISRAPVPEALNCFKTNSDPIVENIGGASVCPHPWEEPCIGRATWCQNEGQTSDLCPMNNVCEPHFQPLDLPEMVICVETKREYHYSEPYAVGWGDFFAAELIRAQVDPRWGKCAPTDHGILMYPTSRDGKTVHQLVPLQGDCDINWYVSLYEKSKTSFNDGRPEGKKQHAMFTLTVYPMDKYLACYDTTTRTAGCKAVISGCEVPCGDLEPCPNGPKDCGSNRCEGGTPKICVSRASEYQFGAILSVLFFLLIFMD